MAKKKKENEARYRIELTENQIKMVSIALEEWFRLRLAQSFDFCNDMAGRCDFSPENPNSKHLFDMYIARRNHLSELMRCFFQIAFEPNGYPKEKTPEMLIVEDIWEAIRYARGVARWGSPLYLSDEPFPKIEKIEG